MNRADWLKEVRRKAEERFDRLWAPIYDENWGATIAPTHAQMMDRFLSLCPPGGLILDAACGTGKYWPMILASGRRVFGIDQSRGMLERLRSKFPGAPLEKLGLQEMRYQEAFDGATCMDALECVFPEDWRLVLDNLRGAVRPGGYVYFTVEIADEKDLEEAFNRGLQKGLPLVYGEWADEEGYHYYPRIEQVKEWVSLAQLSLIEEADGDEYHHFIVRKPS